MDTIYFLTKYCLQLLLVRSPQGPGERQEAQGHPSRTALRSASSSSACNRRLCCRSHLQEQPGACTAAVHRYPRTAAVHAVSGCSTGITSMSSASCACSSILQHLGVNATANWIPNGAARNRPRTHPRTHPGPTPGPAGNKKNVLTADSLSL
jgi:hypothetical protein